MKSQEEKRWERMQQLLLSESQGASPVRISSTRTLFGIKSHVEQVIEEVAAEETAKCIDLAHGRSRDIAEARCGQSADGIASEEGDSGEGCSSRSNDADTE